MSNQGFRGHEVKKVKLKILSLVGIMHIFRLGFRRDHFVCTNVFNLVYTRVPNPASPQPGTTKIHVRQCHHSNQRISLYICQTASVSPYLTARCTPASTSHPTARSPLPLPALQRRLGAGRELAPSDDAWRSVRHAVGGAWRPQPTNNQSEEYDRPSFAL